MADTPKKVVRLIDNIKLELYEGNRKKYVQIWDPTGNNTYNEGDGGPSGIRSPERSKKFQSAEADNDIIHSAIESSEIVRYYYGKRNSSSGIKEYFNYLQDPFSETPPPKRIYGGGGLGTPEVDNVGPTPYYLNNGCKINIKWTGRVPNPKFIVGSFSTPDEAEDYNQSLNPEGPPRWLYDQPILSDMDETDSTENPTLRPQSEWILKTYYNPGNNVTPGKTYSNYRDKPYVNDKFVSITLPTGFTENGGKGYLDWVGSGDGKGLVYSTVPKGTINQVIGINSRGQGIGEEVNISVKNNFSDYAKDEDILKTIINGYQAQVSSLYHTSMYDYALKVCFPDTGTCSQIPYKSPLSKEEAPGATPSVATDVPVLTPKKVKLNVFGLPGVTSLSGETDGSIKVKTKVSLPDFTVYLGDPPGSTGSDASGLNPSGLVEDDVENPDPYEESKFAGSEEEVYKIMQANQIDDVPAGPSFDEKLASETSTGEVNKSEIGKGPILGSKLTNTAVTSMINLAGHRLKPILNDLENYLNKNGYAGAKIGNNGIMRDLRASAYPSSPARASASLHGAGLAIDVTFNIPGFKWSGIGDNGNLSKDANLTKVINNFVKAQGDITWGAVWGNSKPADGVVTGRGVTEYHHFEIRADLIPKYWEPVKDELAKFGLKPTDLKSPGKGSNLHKLMLKLLGDTA